MSGRETCNDYEKRPAGWDFGRLLDVCRYYSGAVSKTLLTSSVFDWNAIEAKTTKTGARRDFFEGPTATLDMFECHVTTINPGEAPHAPHRHPEEELIIVKEGTIEAMQNGVTKRAGPGSMIFEASNDFHGLRNVGQTPATYHVIKWFTPATPKPKS